MTSEPRCVFDANVVISALLFEHSKPGQAFRLALEHHAILISLPVLIELIEVLGRKKFEPIYFHKIAIDLLRHWFVKHS